MHKISNFSRNISGSVIGKMMFSQFTGVNLGRAIISQGVGAFFLVLLLVVYWELALKHQDLFIHHGTCVKETP
jgi:glycerol uptake facilitator-like aquaporin